MSDPKAENPGWLGANLVRNGRRHAGRTREEIQMTTPLSDSEIQTIIQKTEDHRSWPWSARSDIFDLANEALRARRRERQFGRLLQGAVNLICQSYCSFTNNMHSSACKKINKAIDGEGESK